MRRSIIVSLLVAVSAAGCARTVKGLTIKTSAKLMKEGGQAMAGESDLEVARAAIPGQLKTVEGLLVADPKNRTLRQLAARGALEFAYGFLEDDVESLAGTGHREERRAAAARAIAMYERAYRHAMALLGTWDGEIAEELEAGGARAEGALAGLPREAAPAVTIAGQALASTINLARTDPARLALLPRAILLLERGRALDPRYGQGAAATALGIIHAQLGDRETARRDFEEAIAVTGGRYLVPRVAMARALYGKAEHRRQRIRMLAAVVAVRADAAPEFRLANEVARRRAARSLDEARARGPRR